MAADTRYLIVNADDFGRSPGVNRGIIEAHQHGIVTSASLMVRWPAAVEAAAHGRVYPDLSVGLHLDFGEWIYRGNQWEAMYEVVCVDDDTEVADEVSRQLDAFRHLVGKDPTHIDSHQHVHLRARVQSVVTELAGQFGIPVRQCDRRIRYCGRFYGQTAEGSPYPQGIGVVRLIEILAELLPGWTELGCHPGDAADLNTMYRTEREQEVTSLRDPAIREALRAERIQLRSFHEFRSAVPIVTVPPEANR